ncbi:MAG: carboxypeptidase-like regulatory domain-containing protein [Saprospiraceae bacterium]|nr:carboxypeptidase-like regulatory domain-containing protein [Candidatus Vicinibacter proximus]MBL7822559.1 carboxypeptidase-like regulatory domain-containing protein [Saprospiraceae bacterium]MCC6844374.1 carboxypeptidase-like regulatory domain-containing protein [Saprospiraceae bacterium]HRG33656.1 carboxypeptidase-like regulatory domain-containing protein [Saprospiraceae bacterium]
MRFILFCIATLVSYCFVQGQGHYPLLAKNEKIKLSDALKSIEVSRKIHFAFDPQACSQYVVQVKSPDLSTDELLNELLFNLPISYAKQDLEHYLIFIDEYKKSKIVTAGTNTRKIEISGKVKDVFTGEAIIGATISLMPSQGMTETDLNGNFRISVESNYSQPWLEIRYLGYQIQSIKIPSDHFQGIQIQLHPSTEFLQTITVSAPKTINSSNHHNILTNSYRLNPASLSPLNVFRDPIRSLQQLSGVNATDDLSTGIQIRGSGSDENLICLDGLTLYSVDHFYGVFSNINPFILDNLQFYKSYFPANYGGRASSLILMKSKDADKKITGAAELSLLNSNLNLNIPILKNKGTLLFGGRITNQNLGGTGIFSTLFKNGSSNPVNISRDTNTLLPVNPEFNFYDVYTKISFDLHRNTKISGGFFYSKDKLQSKYESKYLLRNLSITENYNDSSVWNNKAWFASFDQKWRRNLNSHLVFSNSDLMLDQTVVAEIITRENNNIRLTKEKTSFRNHINVSQFKWENNYQSKYFDAGLGFEWNNYNTFFINKIERPSQIRIDSRILFKDSLNNGNDYNLFFHSQIKSIRSLKIEPGLRVSRYDRKNQPDWSPRINVSYEWDKHFTTSVRWGIYYQYLRQTTFEDRFGRVFNFWLQPDLKRFDILKSTQLEIQQLFKWKKTTFCAEVYYKNLDGLIEQIFETPSIIPAPGEPIKEAKIFIFSGEGRSYGLDLSADQQIGKYFFNISYSFNHSINRFPQINKGDWYARQFVREHQLKSLQNIELKHWSFNLYGVYGSPQPYTDLSLISDRNRRVIDIKENSKFLKDYLRFDSDIQYKFRITKVNCRAGIAVLNIFDRINVKYVQYIYNLPANQNPNPGSSPNKIVGTEVNLLRRTFNANLTVFF